MNDWSTLLLAVIAVSTGLLALIQIGILIYGARLARRVEGLLNRLELEIDPLLEQVKKVGGDITRAAKLGATQVERADLLVTRLVQRVEETIDATQRLIVEPIKQGATLLEAIRAAFSDLHKTVGRRTDEVVDKEERT